MTRGKFTKFNVVFNNRVTLGVAAWDTLANIATSLEVHNFLRNIGCVHAYMHVCVN